MKGERGMSASSQTLSFAANNVTAGKKKDFFLHRWSRSPCALVFLRQSERTSQSVETYPLLSTFRYERSLSDMLATSIRQAIIVSYIWVDIGVSSILWTLLYRKKYYIIWISPLLLSLINGWTYEKRWERISFIPIFNIFSEKKDGRIIKRTYTCNNFAILPYMHFSDNAAGALPDGLWNEYAFVVHWT